MDVIGIISDTHGLVRPEVLSAFKGASQIIHAGDIGKPFVLESLRKIAPVVAVRGNCDREEWSKQLPKTAVATVGKVSLYVLHDLSELDLEPATAEFGAVIYGHSHQPSIERRNGALFINPGSAGPRRFSLPVSVALLSIDNGKINAEFKKLR